MTSNPPTRRTFRIDVTPEIVTQATERNSGHCVIADALRLAMPDITKVVVDLQTIRFSRDGHRFVYLTPAAAQHVLLDFDQGVPPAVQTIQSGRPIQVAKVAPRAVRPTPKQTRVEDNGHGATAVVTEGGQITTRVGALADPPKIKTDPISKRRYSGQRRTFGLRLLRP